MKKKTNPIAILFAILVSIVLFPFVIATGFATGAVFGSETLLLPERNEQLFDTVVTDEVVDYIYAELEAAMGESMTDMEGITVEMDKFFSKEQVRTMLHDMYTAILSDTPYDADLSAQKAYMYQLTDEYFEANIDDLIREEAGDLYEYMTEEDKAEARRRAKIEYDATVTPEIEAEFTDLETELESSVNVLFTSAEYQDIKQLEVDTGYSLFAREELCEALHLAGYIVLILCGICLFLLALGHLFRPAGFITGAVYTGLTAGIMKCISLFGVPAFTELVAAELSADPETPAAIAGSAVALIENILLWFMEGFDMVATWGFYATVALILLAVARSILRRAGA